MADEVTVPGQELSGSTAGGGEAGTSEADDSTPVAPTDRPIPAERWALVAGLVAVVLLAEVVGWLGFRAYHGQNAEAKRDLLLQTARQAAVNLTTYDYQHIDDDVRRILDSATGSFYDSFSPRTQAFRDIVAQAHSKSVGTVTEAGLESVAGDEGRALVAVSVQSSDVITGAQPRTQPVRMRITVKKTCDGAKASDVVFMP